MDQPSKPIPLALASRSGASLVRRDQYTPSYGFESFDDDESSDGLFEYFRILRRHIVTIFLASAIGLIVGFAIGIPMQPRYQATTSLEVLTMNEDFLNMKQANPTTTSGNDDVSEEQNQAKLLQGVALLQRVKAKLDPSIPLHQVMPRMAASGWRALLHRSEPVASTARQILIEKAAASLKVRPTAKTRILEITVDSTDPKLAADFANGLTQEFIAQTVESRWATVQRTGDWLHRELDDARDKLRKSEDTLQAYASSSGLIFTDETTNVATEKLQQVQQNLSAATADRITKQSRFEIAQNAPPDSLGDVLNDTGLRETQSKVNDLKRQLADLTAIYSPEYSKVRRVQAELDALESAFERQRADILAHIKNDFTEASRREKLLSATYSAQAGEVTGQGEKAIQYNILKRDVDSNRQLYDTMLQQMKHASIASAMSASNVRVVDPAEVPSFPVSPNFKINSAVGLLSGLFLSAIVVLVRDQLDRAVQRPGDVRLWVDLPELGAIPNSSFESRGKSSRKALPAVALTIWRDSPSVLAEAFRSALTSILFMSENGSPSRILLFTSASPAEGKTTVISNLALAAAEIRLKVLVIDADLRRPRVHELFNLPNDFGVSDLLQGDLNQESFAKSVQSTRVPNLHAITAGQPTDASAHLLYSPNVRSLLRDFASEYDLVLIDTPPMMQMTDARIIGRQADAVVLVARAGETSRDALAAAKQRFDEDRIPILGSILNNWNPNRAERYYPAYHPSHRS